MGSKMMLKTLSALLILQTCLGGGIPELSYGQPHATSLGANAVSWIGAYPSASIYGTTGTALPVISTLGLISKLAPTPGEIAAAISAAKEASTAVEEAQKRVQEAKDQVLAQQRLATQKETEATTALQRAEAAAALHRQQASAAANAVILAQQRLAQAKAEVAEKQKIAAVKEAEAAAAIQQSATAAAAQVQKSDYTTAKLAAIQQSGTAATLKHAALAKEATLGATSAALAAAKGFSDISGPWQFHH